MAAKLTQKPLVREVRVYSVQEPVIAEITVDGVYLRVKGARKKVFTPWSKIAESAVTPTDVPSYLHGKPLALLKKQAEKH